MVIDVVQIKTSPTNYEWMVSLTEKDGKYFPEDCQPRQTRMRLTDWLAAIEKLTEKQGD